MHLFQTLLDDGLNTDTWDILMVYIHLFSVTEPNCRE